MNTEVRDKAIWLKAALDLLTNSTTADTGATMNLFVKRATATVDAIASGVSGDTVARLAVRADGRLSWGPGGAAAADFYLERRDAVYLRSTAGILVEQAGGTGTGFGLSVTGDTVSRIALGKGSGNLGTLSFGSGSAVTSLLAESVAGQLDLSDSPATRLHGIGATSAVFKLSVGITGDAQNRWRMKADGVMSWGSGALTPDVQMWRPAASKLQTDGTMYFAGISLPIKAGTPVDADVPGGAASGNMVIDTTAGRIWVRLASGWKSSLLA